MKRLTLAVFGLLGFFILNAWALDPLLVPSVQQEEPNQVTIIVGETQNVSVTAPTKVGVADPKIADIVTVGDSSLVVMGKSKGKTNLFYVDENGDHTLRLNIISEDVTVVAEQIKNVLKTVGMYTVEVTPSQDQGKVLLLGTVRTVGDKERLKTALSELYNKTIDLVQIEEAALVEIAVEVVELNTGTTKEMGFSVPRTVTVEDTPPAADTQWAQFFKIGALQRTESLSWKLDLLENQGKAKVLARPRVLCQSGKEATLLVGGEVPVFTTSVTSLGGSSTDVEYKQYGINLKINPTVSSDNRVQLGLNFDISEIGESDTIGAANSPTAKAYPLKKRTVNTSLHLEDGETLAIGGLIKQKTAEDLAKFPWLADVPVLGAFFRHKTTTGGSGSTAKDDVELFITLTPRIVFSGNSKNKEKKDLEIKSQQKEFVEAYARTDIPRELQDYVLEVQKKIIKSVGYPGNLLGTGWEGTVVLKLIVAKDGKLQEAQMLRSSGYKIFDEDALKVVKGLTYSPFPFESQLETLKLEVPIVYRERK